METVPSRAVVVWTATDPHPTTEHARILVDYCRRAGLDIAAFAALPEALNMLLDGLADAVVVATGRELQAAGIHVAAAMADRPMPVRRPAADVDARDRRPRIVRQPRGGAR